MQTQQKKALAEEHNRNYEQLTAAEEEQIARRVVEIIQAELEPESMDQWKQSKTRIKNRVTNSLGLTSKYRADGSRRTTE